MSDRCARAGPAVVAVLAGHVLKGIRAFMGARRKGRRVLVGIGRKQVRWLALADPRALCSQRALKRAMREVAA